jgi:hypothetical protein
VEDEEAASSPERSGTGKAGWQGRESSSFLPSEASPSNLALVKGCVGRHRAGAGNNGLRTVWADEVA